MLIYLMYGSNMFYSILLTLLTIGPGTVFWFYLCGWKPSFREYIAFFIGGGMWFAAYLARIPLVVTYQIVAFICLDIFGQLATIWILGLLAGIFEGTAFKSP